ncbi:MAG: hypothetical protein VYC46_03540, partial [Pseudomonadota bacterium]|nr:hypothetical protein [Pseudomonadota bacterium]
RPLSEAQLNYAAIDVYYLIDLYRLQRQEFSETNKLEWLEEESNKILVSDSFIETPKDRLFNIQKKEEREILLQFNNMVKAISRTENINPTLFFSKQNQKILLHNTLILGLEGALNNITKWRRELIKDSYSLLVSAFGIS